MLRIAITSLAALVLVGCEPPPPPPPPGAPGLAALKALFIDRIRQDDFVHCLRYDDRDPPKEVVEALQGSNFHVFPASQCTYVISGSGSFHTGSRKRAMFHSLSNFRYGSKEATVDWSSYYHGMWGASGVCVLELAKGHWSFQSCRQLAVS